MKSPRPDNNTEIKKTWDMLFDICLKLGINPGDDPAFPYGGDVRDHIDFLAAKIRSAP